MSRVSVVVTGASGGIGSAITKLLDARGFAVVAIDRVAGANAPLTRHLTFELEQLAADPGTGDALKARVVEASASLGASKIVGLINNAAWQATGTTDCQDAEVFSKTLTINVTVPYLLSRLFRTTLIDSRGCIINVGSIHARQTKPGFCAYATSKAALAGLTRALSVEWGASIRVAAIEPAAIATPMLESGFALDPNARARLAEAHPAGEIGDADLVARWVHHLIVETSQFVNGAVINLDGGVSHRLHDPA